MSQQGFNAIALAIPVFFLLIGLEIWIERRERRLDSGRTLYRLNDTINDLACGTIQQLAGVFGKTVLFAGYILIFERFRLATLDTGNWAHWAVAFLGIDFFYYWFHRASHEVNFLWAAHIVHHQSEEYNLSVALRQSAVQQFLGAPFYWPLALLGVPPMMFLALDAFDTLYQFWIHTRTIGRLGFLDAVLNTPSNHRVHHGSNAKYIDRNHGGVLIVWDRLFGTFQREEEEPAYGVTRPLANWNPLWANVQYCRRAGRGGAAHAPLARQAPHLPQGPGLAAGGRAVRQAALHAARRPQVRLAPARRPLRRRRSSSSCSRWGP